MCIIVPIKLTSKLTGLGLNTSLQLDSRFPHRQTSSGEGRPVHLKLHHPESRSPAGLCPESPALSLYTHDCVSSHRSTSIIKFADDTVVLGLISNNDETAYLDEVERLTSWCQDNCLSLNVSKTKELIVDFRKRHLLPYTPLMISGTPVERVSSFKYLGVNISEDLTWITHIQTRDAPIRIFAADTKYRFLVMVIGRYRCRFWCFKLYITYVIIMLYK